MTGADPDVLAHPASGFFALLDAGEFIGFRSFGQDGQVPGWDYDNSALDTGGGLRPDLTGTGLGRQAIQTGLDFGRSQFRPPAFRVTIAAFNQRAQRVVQALDFQQAGSFRGGQLSLLMVRGPLLPPFQCLPVLLLRLGSGRPAPAPPAPDCVPQPGTGHDQRRGQSSSAIGRVLLAFGESS